jgi:cytochrome P450
MASAPVRFLSSLADFAKLNICSVIPYVVTASRLALKDFKFWDGTVIPAGSFLSVPLYATHHDETKYNNPYVFDPSRFEKWKEDGSGPILQMVTPSVDYIPWGIGKHAWCVMEK